ncbi:hypothetical protein M3Y97_00978800 [Aphelenchoides bicaudatus]|nr:hypothetical protein M3Y97_00978800 [Aphelenchoides bicaudatus]
MASKRIKNQAVSEKKSVTRSELMHKIAVLLKPQMEEWMTVNARLKSFGKEWLYDVEEHAKCTSIALAQAGFIMTSAEDQSARCVCCAKEMIWDATDDPFDEHASHSPHCYLVLEGKPASEMTILDYIRMSLWKSSFEKTNHYRDYVNHLQEAMDAARLRCHELLIDAERHCRN